MSVIARYPTSPTGQTSYSLNAWYEITASTPAAANYLHIIFGYIGASGAYKRIGVDIGIGGAGSEVIRVKGMMTARSVDNYYSMYEYWLPINVPAGSRLAVYAYNIESSMNSVSMSTTLYSLGTHSYEYVDLIGRPSLSGTANAKGSWVQATASAAENYDAIILSTAPTSASGIASGVQFIDVATGPAASETIILNNVMSTTSAVLDTPVPPVMGMMPARITAGQRVAARMQRADTTGAYLNILGLRKAATAPANARLTQLIAEAAGQQLSESVSARLTQQYAEVLLIPPIDALAVMRLEQFLAEVAGQQASTAVNARLTQQYAEVLLRPGTVGDLYPSNAADLNLALGLMI